MTMVEDEILKCLKEVEAGVASMQTAANKPNLIPLFKRLNELADKLSVESQGDLIHYLRNGSYQKARLWLETQSPANGRAACGGRP